MKVKLEEKYRRYYTLEELDAAREIIKQEKEEDNSTAKEWAEYAIREALLDDDMHYIDYISKVISAEATTSKNSRANNAYTNDSGNMDVWIEAVAKTWNGYIEIGAYLTDIWQTGVKHYKEHMYIEYYKKANV